MIGQENEGEIDPDEQDAGKISLKDWYITVKRSELNGEARTPSDIDERDMHYKTGDTFTVTEPDTAIHIDIRSEDESAMDGTLPKGLSVSIRRL